MPKKNIRIINGKPLICWTLDTARQSKYIDEILVSTDSEEIQNIAEDAGIRVSRLRPAEFATDESPRMDFVNYELAMHGNVHDNDLVVMLEPTSPLRTANDVDSAIERLLSSSATSIVGVAENIHASPDLLVTLENGLIRPCFRDDYAVIRRQEARKTYFYEGSFFISYRKALRDNGEFYHSNTIGYIISRLKSLNIDNLEDFQIIELIMREGLIRD